MSCLILKRAAGNMRAMTTPAPASPTGSLPAVTGSWKIFVLWAGLPLCLFGMTWHGLWQEWEAGRFGELILLSLLVWGLSWPLRRFARWPLASTLALFWSLALVLFAGALPVAATLLLAVSALAVGSLVAERQPFALQIACGLVVMGALLAWLLLLPLHTRWTYLALCLIPIVLRYRYLAVAFQQTRSHWQKAIAADPRAAALAILVLGLGSVGTWLPTMQFDDVGYHLRLPWQLLEQARYVPDPETHIWALAPWLGDVLQAIPQLISGAEARGPVNALWMVLTACGIWHLTRALEGDARAGWASIALYGSLPLTATLAGSMQTEAPTTALLVWLAVLIARKPLAATRALYCGAILVGGLLGLKLASVVAALLLLPWALWTQRPLPRAPPLAVGMRGRTVAGRKQFRLCRHYRRQPIPALVQWLVPLTLFSGFQLRRPALACRIQPAAAMEPDLQYPTLPGDLCRRWRLCTGGDDGCLVAGIHPTQNICRCRGAYPLVRNPIDTDAIPAVCIPGKRGDVATTGGHRILFRSKAGSLVTGQRLRVEPGLPGQWPLDAAHRWPEEDISVAGR